MTFIEAMQRAAHLAGECRIWREHGPELVIDGLGQVHIKADCLYAGDLLDMDDWQIKHAEIA